MYCALLEKGNQPYMMFIWLLVLIPASRSLYSAAIPGNTVEFMLKLVKSFVQLNNQWHMSLRTIKGVAKKSTAPKPPTRACEFWLYYITPVIYLVYATNKFVYT